MPMRGLTIVVAGPDPERFHAALSLAATQAALGARARLYLHAEAVALLRPSDAPGDAARTAAGLPSLAQLGRDALELGVEIIACQSGLALAALDAATLDPRIAFGGMVGLLGTLAEDRLLFA